MTDEFPRRRFLGAAAVSTAGLAGCTELLSSSSDDTVPTSTGSETPTPNGNEAELRQRIDELETELADCRTLIEKEEDRIDDLELETRTLDDELDLSEEIHDRLRGQALDARASVIKLIVESPVADEQTHGTGWVYDDGLVVTNAHNVFADDTPVIETFDGDHRDGVVVGKNEDMRPDVALVEVSTDGLDPLSTGASTDLDVGDAAIAIGHPNAYGDWLLSVGEYLGSVGDSPGVGITIPSSGGSSGSPIIDGDGRVVGMHARTDWPEDVPPNPEEITRSGAVFERYPETVVAFLDPMENLEEELDEWIDTA